MSAGRRAALLKNKRAAMRIEWALVIPARMSDATNWQAPFVAPTRPKIFPWFLSLVWSERTVW